MWVSFLQICYITDVSTHSDSLTINYPILLWDFGPTEGTTRGKIMPSGLKCSTIASGRVLSDSCIIQVFLPSKQLFALSFFFLLPMFFISLYSPMWYYQSLDSIQKSLLIINEIGNMNVICFLAIQWVSLAHVEYPQPVFCQVTFLYCWSLCFFPYYLKSLFFSCLFKFISSIGISLFSLCWYFGSSDTRWLEKIRQVERSFIYIHCPFGTPLLLLYYQEKFPRCLYDQAQPDNMVPIHLQRHIGDKAEKGEIITLMTPVQGCRNFSLS